MELINLLITLLSGAAGGNIAGAAAPSTSLGTAGNSIIGLLGGGLGHYLLKHFTGIDVPAAAVEGAVQAVQHLDIQSILANIGASGVGGAVLTLIVGLIKSSLDKKA